MAIFKFFTEIPGYIFLLKRDFFPSRLVLQIYVNNHLSTGNQHITRVHIKYLHEKMILQAPGMLSMLFMHFLINTR